MRSTKIALKYATQKKCIKNFSPISQKKIFSISTTKFAANSFQKVHISVRRKKQLFWINSAIKVKRLCQFLPRFAKKTFHRINPMSYGFCNLMIKKRSKLAYFHRIAKFFLLKTALFAKFFSPKNSTFRKIYRRKRKYLQEAASPQLKNKSFL